MNRRPVVSITILTVILAGCIIIGLIPAGDPYYMDPSAISLPPDPEHLFGTDPLGRDLFALIWHGGRLSLTIGLLSTLIASVIAILYGTASGSAGRRVDDCLMRMTEILMSIPQILIVMVLAALTGGGVVSISLSIGLTGWMPIARMIRSEVRQLRSAGFVLAARQMGGGFFYILWHHLLPNYLPQVTYMIISHIGSAIAMEATLSFLGLGLPSDVVSWGTLLSLSQNAILTGNWWTMIIPGVFLVVTILCITEIGESIRRKI